MKIVLWAYHEAGYRVLRKLHAMGHELLVFTLDNAPHVPSVARLAESLGYTVNIGSAESYMLDKTEAFQPEIGFSVYYPEIISQSVLDRISGGAFNFHPSLLPRHRGCFSAPWAILEEDVETGVTCHEMLPEVDSGRILCQQKVLIDPGDTAFSLYYKLVDATVNLVSEALSALTLSPIVLTDQKQGGCYHPREIPFNGQIDPAWSRDKIARFIRAMYFPPYQPAQVVITGTHYPVYTMADYQLLMQQEK